MNGGLNQLALADLRVHIIGTHLLQRVGQQAESTRVLRPAAVRRRWTRAAETWLVGCSVSVAHARQRGRNATHREDHRDQPPWPLPSDDPRRVRIPAISLIT